MTADADAPADSGDSGEWTDEEIRASLSLSGEAATEYIPLATDGPTADTPMWLSHHWPDQYDRCAVIAGRHVCRRCLVMYPVSILAAVVAALGWWWPRGWDDWLIPLLPLPAVVDFVLDNLGLADYSPRRQMILTAIGSLAAGAGYVRYLDRPGDPLVWGTVIVYGTICLAAALGGHRRRTRGTA